jgi:hypothetical protein
MEDRANAAESEAVAGDKALRIVDCGMVQHNR